ncbi:MAG: hypothetical protein E7231_06530 [Cellulosilyticum sp.]|nr:hypothetical protein [Cellulosilyticum sp.]
MLCERCKEKMTARREIVISCKTCGKEEYVPLYNNNQCKTCNQKSGTCEECGRMISKMKDLVEGCKDPNVQC